MNSTEDIVELSENDDDEDCVLESVIYEDSKSRNNKEFENDTILNENSLLAEFIENCLNLENSDGMKRVINGTLLKIYTETNENFKKSIEFKKALRRAINLLKIDPGHKFSHVKDLCEILKLGNAKKRVQLTTLSSNIKANKLSCKRKSEMEICSKIPKLDIIDLDSSEDVHISILDEYETNLSPDNSINGEKENELNDTCSQNNDSDDNKLLKPHKELEYNEIVNDRTKKISKIEAEIAMCQRIIGELDEEEVCNDSVYSPYVKSEKFKARIVFLYKELCNLTGEEPVKKSIIHLKVIDGHPAGPVQRLERFLNRNSGSDGHPPFPNFRDVVKCVLKANEEDNLGWSKQQIMNEASALFTHCGRALQKRRQRREWRDLLSKVKVEACDDDPADKDPELRARLEANKQIALKKETEILERYSMMQNMPPKRNITKNIEPKDSDEFSKHSSSHSDSSSDESCNNEDLRNEMKTSSHKNEVDINANNDNILNNVNSYENNDNCGVKVKKERESNICQMLEELGDNYTTTVIDIEDPFVVIEISDSSDEDS